MPFKIDHNSYGKSKVRLTKVTRNGDVHELKELSVDVLLRGDFQPSYTDGDNTKIVATDSMKNTVYVVAKENRFASTEEYALLLARHFVATYAHVDEAQVDVFEQPWKRIVVNENPHDHAFESGGNEEGTVTAIVTRQKATLTSGLRNLLVLKTTGSGFSDFVRDRYTTLKDTTDRIFATSVTATWEWSKVDGVDFVLLNATIRSAMLDAFASTYSLAVQQTLNLMAEAALNAVPDISSVTITMPNKHRLLVNLAPFGLTNDNEIFVPTDEPHGLITGKISRK